LFLGLSARKRGRLEHKEEQVELYEHIRREYEHGAGTIRAVARRLGVHRREVRQALASAVPQSGRSQSGSDRSWPGAVVHRRDSGADCRAPRKQRHTAHRIWTRLRQEKPEIVVGESTVREYVRQRKQAMGCWDTRFFVAQSYPVWRRSTGGLVRDLCRDRRPAAQNLRLLHALDWPPARPFIGPIRTPRSRHFLRLMSWHSIGLASLSHPEVR